VEGAGIDLELSLFGAAYPFITYSLGTLVRRDKQKK
jgi:hypothetical protein